MRGVVKKAREEEEEDSVDGMRRERERARQLQMMTRGV